MSVRSRFHSAWNGIALIIFFAGIFMGFQPWGYSSFLVAIFMWIIGGTVVNILFGSEDKKGKDPDIIQPTRDQVVKSLSCPSCGHTIDEDTYFCPECGVSIEIPAK